MSMFSGTKQNHIEPVKVHIPRQKYQYVVKAYKYDTEMLCAREYFGQGQFKQALAKATEFYNTKLFKIKHNSGKVLKEYTKHCRTILREWTKYSDESFARYWLIKGDCVKDLRDEEQLTGTMMDLDYFSPAQPGGLFLERPYCYLTKNHNTIIRQNGGYDI